jgi:adenylate cyclase class 2
LALEIELKAHVQGNLQNIKRLLSEKAEYMCEFEKEDVYYFPPGPSDIPRSGVRLRSESRILPDGAHEKTVYVTYKTKEERDGIEINDEKEFEVRSSQCGPETAFNEFLKMAGLQPGFSKHKKGWAFSKDEIKAELLEVEKLGWFLELEIVVNDSEVSECKDTVIVEKKERLMEFLSDIGIEKGAIESRYYSEMLKPESPSDS